MSIFLKIDQVFVKNPFTINFNHVIFKNMTKIDIDLTFVDICHTCT